MHSMYAVFSGNWGHNDTTAKLPDSANYFVNFTVEVGGGSGLTFLDGNITLTGPAEDPYSNIDVKYNLVLVIPTLHTNSEGKLTSITFEYKLPDETVINPAGMLTYVMVQLTYRSANQFYNGKEKLTSKTRFTGLSIDPPLDISSLYQIDVWYDDILGNQYDIIWR